MAIMASSVIGPLAAADESAPCGPIRLASAVVVEGDFAPETGGSFQGFDRPAVGSGESLATSVAFTADIDGPTAVDDVVYVGARLVLREGDAIGDGTVDVIEPFAASRPSNAALEAVVGVTLAGVPEGTEDAVVHERTIVAREGQVIPDGSGDRYERFDFLGLTDDGRVGFMAVVSGPASGDAIIQLGDDVVVRKGDVVPWEPTRTWDGRFDEVVWTGSGDVLFEGNMTGDVAADRVIVRGRRQADGAWDFEPLAFEGASMASPKGPVVLDVIEQCAVAEGSVWAARGLLRDLPPGLNDVVFGHDGIVAIEGDSVDGVDGAIVGRIMAVSVDGRGRIVWAAELDGTPPPGVTHGIFVGTCLLATSGMELDGMEAGTILTSVGFEDLVVDDHGRVVFAGTFAGPQTGDGLFVIELDDLCLGDLDGTGFVDHQDLLALIAAWGPCATGSCLEDLTADGGVGFDDLLALLASWGACGDA